jgi:MFS transporter, FHS family, Na+ dependent glucose transporter 1
VGGDCGHFGGFSGGSSGNWIWAILEGTTLNKYRLLTTIAYCASFVAMGISMSSLGPTIPSLAENTRASISAISILFAARSLGSLVSSVWGGQLYDRVRGHGVLAVMILCMAASTALTPFIPLLWVLSIVLFITGIAQGVLNIGGNVLLVWLHGRGVGPSMNALHFFFGVGTFIAPVIVAQFITLQGGLVLIYLFLAIIILPTAMVALLPSPASPDVVQQNGSKKNDPWVILYIALVFGCYSGGAFAFSGWIFTYATELNLTNETNAAYLTSLFWGALTVGRLIGIPIATRVRPRTILWADFGLAFASLLVMLAWPRSLGAVIFTSAALGLALASIYPTTMALSGEVMALSGKITGYFSLGNSAGTMLIPWVIGPLFERVGPVSMTLVLLADMLLAMGLLWLLSRRTAKRAPVVAAISL